MFLFLWLYDLCELIIIGTFVQSFLYMIQYVPFWDCSVLYTGKYISTVPFSWLIITYCNLLNTFIVNGCSLAILGWILVTVTFVLCAVSLLLNK